MAGSSAAAAIALAGLVFKFHGGAKQQQVLARNATDRVGLAGPGRRSTPPEWTLPG